MRYRVCQDISAAVADGELVMTQATVRMDFHIHRMLSWQKLLNFAGLLRVPTLLLVLALRGTTCLCTTIRPDGGADAAP